MHYKTGSIKQYGAICLLLVMISCTSRQTAVAKLLSDPANGLLQVKKTNQHTIVMEVLPNNTLTQTVNSNQPGFLRVKLALRSNEKIKGSALMQYMNFGIRNNLYVIRGGDSLPCIVCERIPGINEKEFLYLALFDSTGIAHSPETSLQLLVADTIAGFGSTVFDIRKDAIKKMEAIK